jgi:hypothetical protein
MSWLPKELLEFYATTTTIRAGTAISATVRKQLLSWQQLSGQQHNNRNYQDNNNYQGINNNYQGNKRRRSSHCAVAWREAFMASGRDIPSPRDLERSGVPAELSPQTRARNPAYVE